MEELETRLDNSDTEEQVQAVVENICGEAVHRHLLGGRTEQNAYILQAKSYIDAHYGENISLALLAEKIHINPAYLSTLFKKDVYKRQLGSNDICPFCTILACGHSLRQG